MLIKTPHMNIESDLVSKTVIISGDPLRTKFISEKYLTDSVLINEVRGMLGYCGYYKNVKVTLMTSGMGMPSMGIYAYELYKFFDVENIIRIGSAGTTNPNIKIMDIVLSEQAHTEGNFAYNFNNNREYKSNSSTELNNVIIKTAEKMNIPLKKGLTFCGECFDPYLDSNQLFQRLPKETIALEMEAFSLFYTAQYFNKRASCLLTIADSMFSKENITSEQRQLSLTKMIELALESAILIENGEIDEIN